MSETLKLAAILVADVVGYSRLADQRAAEVLRPRPVQSAVEDHVADAEGAQLLRPGRNARERIDRASHEKGLA